MAKIMDPILPRVSVLKYWGHCLGLFWRSRYTYHIRDSDAPVRSKALTWVDLLDGSAQEAGKMWENVDEVVA